MGVAAAVASELVTNNQPDRLRDAIRAAGTGGVRNPAAWVVRALRDGWEFEGRLAGVRAEQTHQHRRDREIRDARAAEQLQREDRRRAAGWSAAISAALDDNALGRAIAAVTRPPTGLQRLPVPLAHAQLLAWAIEAHQRAPDQPLQAALRVALASDSVPTAAQLSDEWPEPPHASADHAGTTDLTTRIASRLSCPAQQRTTQARSI